VQIAFHEDLPLELHAMPPGGFRLAVVNGFDLRATLAASKRLKAYFLPTHRVSAIAAAPVL
jgi:hypothetical protein